jgi:TfoX/Sxy family transcriptional regulator of competence genes
MAYDERLAQRIAAILTDEPAVTSRKMFGGLGFMVEGHLTVAATTGGLMVRTDPAAGHEWLDETTVTQVEMRGRPMPGWLLVATEALGDDETLRRWVDRGVAYVHSLPPQQA